MPVYSEDGTLTALKVKQTNEIRGENRLRLHKIDIALFNEDASETVIRGVIIKDQEETEVQLPAEAVKPAGIMVNYDDQGYMKVTYDQKTLDWMEEHLHEIQSKTARSVIWRNLWDHVKNLKMSSSQYLRFISKQFVHEDVY